MKKLYPALGCALGGILIGFFANFLTTVWGCVVFGLGVGLLVCSMYRLTEKDEK